MEPTPPIRRPWIALPRAHFLGLAPLDVWARMLWIGRRGLRPRYALRGLFCVWTSLIGTAVTLPERLLLAPWLWWRFGRGSARLHGGPPVVVVVGYYRSGTTHLHYLLSCDRRFVTPRWFQVSGAAGWWLAWTVLRWAMIPLTPNRRPQDDVAFGPEWPAEDDFALASWTMASSLAWRYVFPSQAERARRWQFLEGERERARFARTLAAFCWKVSAHSRRRLLLKSPAHTARVGVLAEVLGERVRFVHIVREPGAVVRSNARMARTLAPYLLEDPPPVADVREWIAGEYERSDRIARGELSALGPGRWCRVRYEDLAADPLGELERVYAELGLGWDDEVRQRVTRYLGAVASYRTAEHAGSADARAGEGPDAAGPVERAACERLRAIDPPAPARAPRPASVVADPRERVRRRAAWAITPLVAAACLGLWFVIGRWQQDRVDGLVWLWGTFIGYAAVRVAGRGTGALGLWAAGWFMALIGVSVWYLPEVAEGWTGVDRLRSIESAYGSANNNYVWTAFGVLAAWRFASRRHVRPPGR